MIAELRNRIKKLMFSLCSLSCKERQGTICRICSYMDNKIWTCHTFLQSQTFAKR